MTNKNILSIEGIRKLIPHRYPMLLVDRVLSITPEKIVALKNVTANEEYFAGHFPGLSVMPGVLIIEAVAQASAILVAYYLEESVNREVYLMSIDIAKFRKVVTPGDTLILESEIVQFRSNVYKFSGYAKVHDEVVAEVKLTAMLK